MHFKINPVMSLVCRVWRSRVRPRVRPSAIVPFPPRGAHVFWGDWSDRSRGGARSAHSFFNSLPQISSLRRPSTCCKISSLLIQTPSYSSLLPPSLPSSFFLSLPLFLTYLFLPSVHTGLRPGFPPSPQISSPQLTQCRSIKKYYATAFFGRRDLTLSYARRP